MKTKYTQKVVTKAKRVPIMLKCNFTINNKIFQIDRQYSAIKILKTNFVINVHDDINLKLAKITMIHISLLSWEPNGQKQIN